MKNKILFPALLLTILFATFSSAQPGRGFGKGYIFDKLNLTEEQENKFDDMRIKHQKEMVDLKSELEKAQLDLKQLTNDGNYSRNDFLSAHKKVQTARTKIGDSWANHRMDMRDILTSEQRTKLAELKDDMRDDFRPMRKNHMKRNRSFHRGTFCPW